MIWTGFEPGAPGRKATNAITTELQGIALNTVVRYCIYIGRQPCLKEWSPIIKCFQLGQNFVVWLPVR